MNTSPQRWEEYQAYLMRILASRRGEAIAVAEAYSRLSLLCIGEAWVAGKIARIDPQVA